MSAARVDAIVVNHNGGGALIPCVASLRNAGIERVVVVDNSSSDGSLERLAAADHDVVLLPTGANLGYGTAVNRGMAHTEAEFVLVCNADLIVDASAPATLADVLIHNADTAITGPTIIEANGDVYPSARAFPSPIDAIGHSLVGLFNPNNPWTHRYKRINADTSHEGKVDWVSGACMLVRRIAFASVGGFDEGYFMYVEDLDLCWRLQRGGWATHAVPEAVVTHDQGGSSRSHPYRLLIAHHRSTWRFAKRSLPSSQRGLLPLIGLGIAARLVVALVRAYALNSKPRTNPDAPEVG